MGYGMILDAEGRRTLHDKSQHVVHQTRVDCLGHALDPECRLPRHRMVVGQWIRNVGRGLKLRKDT